MRPGLADEEGFGHGEDADVGKEVRVLPAAGGRSDGRGRRRPTGAGGARDGRGGG